MANRVQDEWLSAGEAAAAKGLSRQAITLAIRKKRLPAKKVGNYWAIRRADLDAWTPEPRGPKRRTDKLARLREMQRCLSEGTPSVDEYLAWKREEIDQELRRDEALDAQRP